MKSKSLGDINRKRAGSESARCRLQTLALAIVLIMLSALMSSCITINVPADESGQSVPTEEIDLSEDDPAISEEEVTAIVLDRVPGATEEEIISFSLEKDDGRWEYEGTLLHDGIEYEFEIDGQNGNILEWEMDD